MLAISRWLCAVAFVAALGVLVSACGDSGSGKRELTEADIAQLEERVRARWQTLEAKDFGATWEYSTPTYRALFPKRLFVNKFSYAVDWQLTGVEVVNYDADAAVASVAVRVMSKSTKQTAVSAKFGALPSTIRENWVLTDGEWWHSANI